MAYQRKNLELLIAPPYIFLFSALIAWILSLLFSSLEFQFRGQNELAILLFVLGGLMGGRALVSFIRESTTFHPEKPYKTRKLVKKGVYRFTRNPMYLGLLLGLCGWAVFLGNGWPFLSVLFFVWYISRFQIKPEERILEEKFGEDYIRYKESVRRWI